MQKGVLLAKSSGRQGMGRSYQAACRFTGCEYNYGAHFASMISHCYWLWMGESKYACKVKEPSAVIYCYLYRPSALYLVRFWGSPSRLLNYFPIISLISHIPYSFLWMVASNWQWAASVKREKSFDLFLNLQWDHIISLLYIYILFLPLENHFKKYDK